MFFFCLIHFGIVIRKLYWLEHHLFSMICIEKRGPESVQTLLFFTMPTINICCCSPSMQGLEQKQRARNSIFRSTSLLAHREHGWDYMAWGHAEHDSPLVSCCSVAVAIVRSNMTYHDRCLISSSIILDHLFRNHPSDPAGASSKEVDDHGRRVPGIRIVHGQIQRRASQRAWRDGRFCGAPYCR